MSRIALVTALAALVAFLLAGLSAVQAAVTDATLAEEPPDGDPVHDALY